MNIQSLILYKAVVSVLWFKIRVVDNSITGRYYEVLDYVNY